MIKMILIINRMKLNHWIMKIKMKNIKIIKKILINKRKYKKMFKIRIKKDSKLNKKIMKIGF